MDYRLVALLVPNGEAARNVVQSWRKPRAAFQNLSVAP
jgi:hypothetical protein